jgi:hypothetical protein
MSGMTPRPCRSCGAPLIWGVTMQGRRMPVDAQPVGKRIVLEPANTGHEDLPPLATVVDVYASHWETCPHADQHRKKKLPAQPAPQGKPR